MFGGGLYISNDGGGSFTDCTTSFTTTITDQPGWNRWSGASSSVNGSALVAISSLGVPGVVVTSWDGGQTWQDRTSSVGGLGYYQGVASDSSGRQIVVVENTGQNAAAYGLVHLSRDFGVSWSDITTAVGGQWVQYQAVASSPSGIVLVTVTWDGYVYVSVDSGGNWADKTSPDWSG